MKPSEVQAYIAAQIAARPSLADFMPVMPYDPEQDEDAAAQAIGAQLRADGVCIQVGTVSVPTVPHVAGNTFAALASIEVYVGEKIGRVHALKGLALIEEIVRGAVPTPGPSMPKWVGYDAGKHEQGYLLHVIEFSVPVVLR